MGGKIDFVCLVATMLSRDGIVVIKFTKSRKMPRHFFLMNCFRSVPWCGPGEPEWCTGVEVSAVAGCDKL